MKWDVNFTTKAVKQKNKFNEDLQAVLLFLVEDLKNTGGNPGKSWSNYGKFKGLKGQKKSDDWRHCHLLRKRATITYTF